MKIIAILLFYLMTNFSATVTNKDFELMTDKNELIIARSNSQQLHVSLVRAKGYQKASAKMGLSSSLPTGVSIQFEPKEGVISETQATISADDSAVAGTYNIILNSTINHKTKGTVLKLVIE